MANKGILGSQAGAALQQMFLRLESPTQKGYTGRYQGEGGS